MSKIKMIAAISDLAWRSYAFGVAIFLGIDGRFFESAALMCLWSISVCLTCIALKYLKDEPRQATEDDGLPW